jgi:hypothetical protein
VPRRGDRRGGAALFGSITTGGDPRNVAIGAGGTVVIANQAGWFDVVR